MSLRLRLIVAFFVLSVVPLAAVTLITYASNARAVREAAGREAELLAGELSQRMQVVTAQLSERVERLMEVADARAEAQAEVEKFASAQRAAEQAAARTAAAESTPTTQEVQVAQALGEMAMLLDNIELRGLRGVRPPTAGRRDGAPPSDGRQFGSGRSGGERGESGRGARQNGPTGPPPPAAIPAPPTPGARPSPNAAPRPATVPPTPSVGTIVPPPRPATAPPGPLVGPLPDPNERRDRLTIDVGPMRREVMRQFVPDGQWEKLSDEDRRRIMGEVNQRMLGIAQGIQLGAAEAQKRVAEAQRAADAKAQVARQAEAKSRAEHISDTRAKAAAAAARTMPQPTSAAPPRRRTALSGSRLDVTFERDGKVVRAANAEVNLPNLLATVLTTTRRDRGEIPFAVGKDGHLYTQTDDDKKKIEGIGGDVARANAAAGTERVGDWIVVSPADPTGPGLRFGIARPVGDSLQTLRRASARNAGLGLGFIGLALIGIFPLSSRLTRNLSTLLDGVHRIARGDYGARVNVSAKDEVGRLATAFNHMAADIERHQRSAVEQERIKRELELGRQIQYDMLPRGPLRAGLTEIKGVSVPAKEVGGDFFNYFSLADGRIALLVGDVSGKGVGAALLMANIQASLRTRLALGQDLDAIARELDLDIEGSTPGSIYATLFVGIFDPTTRELRYVNAGHNPQYVLRSNGTLEHMSSSGLPVGLIAGRGYLETRVQLTPHDLLFFYTDGCVEAENEAGEMFGAERLEQLLASAAQSEDLLARVETVVSSYRGTREPFDDATMMVVRVG
jgi:serine phosphatase RsbU (regulator of sigma subunit)